MRGVGSATSPTYLSHDCVVSGTEREVAGGRGGGQRYLHLCSLRVTFVSINPRMRESMQISNWNYAK